MKWPVTLSTPGGNAARRAFQRGLSALLAGRLEAARRAFESAAALETPLRDRALRIVRELDGLRAKAPAVRARRLARLAREEAARPLWMPEAILAEVRLLAISELRRTGRFEVPGLGTFRVERRTRERGGRRPQAARGLATSDVVFSPARSVRERTAGAGQRAVFRLFAPPPRVRVLPEDDLEPQDDERVSDVLDELFGEEFGERPARRAAPGRKATSFRRAPRSGARAPVTGRRPASAARPPSPETPRYTDVVVYAEHLYPSDEAEPAARLPDHRPLVSGHPYTLEVAIRARRLGIGRASPPKRSVRNPRKDTERLTVYVFARPASAAIRIAEPLAKIAWPFDADSEPARFRLTVPALSGDGPARCPVDVSLYDATLDLLDAVRVTLVVVADGTAQASDALPATLEWRDDEPAIVRVDPRAARRDLAICVRSTPDGFAFDYLVRRASGGVVRLTVTRRITIADLERLLTKVRDFWTDLVITTYAARLEVSRPTFARYLGQLRALGLEAWALLFGTRRADQEGASETAGRLLAALDLREGASIQVDVADAPGFVFPWSVLYSPAAADETVDPLRFWGARYRLEQVTGGPRTDGLTEAPVKVVFVLDPKFGNAEAQRTLLEGYRSAAGDRLVVTPPISDEPTLVSELVHDPSAHLVYFYCHGYAASEGRFLGRDGVRRLRERIEAVPEGSPEREALETLLSLTARMDQESWVHIGDAEIRESRLKQHPFFNGRRPMVFLNMCQSADLLPSMSSGLVRVFLDHNASAVLGTESPMTAVFANAFAGAIFDALLAGDSIGTALWNARRHFLGPERRNPLGLAYTLYGRGVAMLGDTPLVPAAPRGSPPRTGVAP